ncbi:pirin family protein [Hymenobacter weizhouensis]|uniref:pirin family protein n=1 Tax=Hymenobacter sp. YIM 151500-1 TaxID=2987689 RepID=UPI002227B3D2|nr:hypothetical protein [Hymenobacter sp. YIM 151500-1]UYZ62796.1 hypothetical protein OIS53_17585 [Hymenobacter sp. YIM 151500-1]
MQQIPGKLFLADQRGTAADAHFRRFSTFHFGEYRAVHKEPFGRLLAVNEETLAAGRRVSLAVPEAAHVLVLPLTGAVQASLEPGKAGRVEVEELGVLTAPAGSTVHFTNPYPDEVIHFLHLWVAGPATTAASRVSAFNAEELVNQLGPLLPTEGGSGLPFRVSMGQFGGRVEVEYQLQRSTARFFAFVLAGAFEIAGRLLHEKDGVALWDTPAVELEALSNEAVVLVIELEA